MFKKESGFTLVELLVSLSVIAVVIGTVVSLVLTVQNTQRSTSRMESATRAAQREVESLRNNNYTSLTAGTPIDFTGQLPDNLPRKKGTVTVSEPNDGLKRVNVTVEYYEGQSKKEVKLSSLVGILGITQ